MLISSHSQPTAEAVIFSPLPCGQCRIPVCSFPISLASLVQKCLPSLPVYCTSIASLAFAARKTGYCSFSVYPGLAHSREIRRSITQGLFCVGVT